MDSERQFDFVIPVIERRCNCKN